MVNLFGNTDALIGSMDLLFGAIFVLGALIFRKSVANDSLDRSFSVIGSCVPAIIAYLVMSSFVDNIRYSFGVGILFWIAGGFLLGDIIGDGVAGGRD